MWFLLSVSDNDRSPYSYKNALRTQKTLVDETSDLTEICKGFRKGPELMDRVLDSIALPWGFYKPLAGT